MNAEDATAAEQEVPDLTYSTTPTTPVNFTEENKKEILRILAQYLHAEGLTESAQKVQEESGVHIEEPQIQRFRENVL